MKLVISGGHPSPAFAIIDTLRQTHPEIEIVFVGRVVAQHGTGQLAAEQSAAQDRGIPFYPIETAKWGTGILEKILAIGSVLVATLKSIRLLRRLKPDVFLSFGSYVAVPLALASKVLGIPVITHEQTRVSGVSNRVIARWADTVAISYPESAPFFPGSKTVVTGLPLRPQLFQDSVTQPDWASPAFLTSENPILYITGGSTGSSAINELVASILPELLTHWRIVHPCGKPTKKADWQKTLSEVRQTLPQELQQQYILTESVSVSQLAWLYRQPVLVFGRAGANTTAEVDAFGLPAIFVPLPLSNYDEQQKNAQALVDEGQAQIILQKDLTREQLLSALASWRDRVRPSGETFEHSQMPTACDTLIALVLQTYQNKQG